MLTNLIIFLRLALLLLIRLLGTSLWFFGLLPLYLVGALVMPSHRYLPKVRALMYDLEPSLLVPPAPAGRGLPGYRNPPPPHPRRGAGADQRAPAWPAPGRPAPGPPAWPEERS